MSLRDLCAGFTGIGGRLPLGPPQTGKVAQRLEQLGVPEGPPPPPPEELEATRDRIRAALASGAPIDRRDLKRAPWCIFATDRPLGEEPSQLDALLERIGTHARRSLLRALAHAYLYFFRPDWFPVAKVGAFLAGRIDCLGDPWAGLHEDLCLFAPQAGIEAVARRALECKDTPDAIFLAHGFRNLETLGAFRKQAFFKGLELLASDSHSDPLDRLKTVQAWATQNGRLRYQEARARVANAFICPFGEATPGKDIRDLYLSVIVPLLDDPRTKPGQWVGCDKAKETVRRWLTEIALRQFFDVVDKVANPEHWVYRRAFWDALYERGYIDEAWAVFNYAGAEEARRMFAKDISFGRFKGPGGVQSGQAALLMRIGTLVIAEWSHSGSCRIWDESRSRQKVPRLFEQDYSSGDLREGVDKTDAKGIYIVGPQAAFRHDGSQVYSWQKEIADYLYQVKRIRLRESDYRVHG
jgi:hypothetical protein